jgi:two-component system, chemotaxis family, response regulator Rcp1
VSDPSTGTRIEILLVEDNRGDARLIEKFLRDGEIPTRISHVRDGVMALAFLRRDGAFRDAPRPELIILDLNLPRMSGRELLVQIKRDPKLKFVPVVVLTGSADAGQLAQTLDVEPDCFIQKPIEAKKFVAMVRAIDVQNSEMKIGATTANTAKARLLSNWGHELRTRLNSITGFAELMELQLKGALSSEYQEYAHDIHECALALQRVVFDILDLSKIEMRRLTLSETTFALGSVIEPCIAALREQAFAAGIRIAGNAPGALPWLNGDEQLIRELLTTLFKNTITHGKPGESLTVRAEVANAGGLYISMKDTGVGIVVGDAAKAGEGDERVPSVGLSLCRSIVELHGGRLEVVNEMGGVTVSAYFPASRTVQPQRKAAADAKPAGSFTARSVV